MYQTTAIFFDGKTSTGHRVELQVNDRTGEFRFHPSGFNPVIWQLDDLRYERYGNYIELKHRNDSLAFLQIDDAVFIDSFIEHLKRKSKMSPYERLISLGFKKHLLIAVSLFALIVAAYLLLLPVVAEKAVTFIPLSFDKYLGSSFMSDYMNEHSVDTTRSLLLNDFAEELELNNVQALNFTVVDSEVVNAFALPSGDIVIFSGLLDKMQSYEELAGLIGHEVIHINGRHSLRMLCKNLAGYIFLSVLFSDINGIMGLIAENAHNLNSLSYSREYEREADYGGVSLMIQNKINPEGMLQLFDRLQESSKLTVPELLSTHPVTDERIRYIKTYIEEQNYQTEANESLSLLFSLLKAAAEGE